MAWSSSWRPPTTPRRVGSGPRSWPTGSPFTSFAVRDVQAEYERLVERGVRFVQPPTTTGATTAAVLDDACGNLIRIESGSPA